ncbi:MAG TPA: c-type cytochrome [Casimicrobiaceae bacterium]|nr:c-type cytochrome [Casimicrobiaceae bacterium]
MAVVLVLLVVGSLLFHYLSPWYFLPIASNWGTIDDTVHITFWVTGFVFVVVNLFMAWCVLRYRSGRVKTADYEPENKRLEGWLVLLTSVGVAAMLTPGLFAWAKFIDVPKDAAVVEVVGRQWNFNYRFPGEDGVLGTVDARFVSDTNPFGINPDDPNGRDDILISTQELHIPVGKPIKMELRALDVLHDFTVPQMRSKMNMAPGLVTYLWYTPTRIGKFDAFCEQLCGIGHYAMRATVVVDDEATFQKWKAGFPTFAQTQSEPPGDATAGAALYAVCAACHGAQGEGNPALNAPKLAGQQDWYLKRQLANFKAGARGANDKDTYGKTMAPMAQTLPDDTAVNNVVAYIKTLPDAPAAATVTGNAKDGHGPFENCAACHGAQGQGLKATNAPRLRGMSDWYLVTQLKNFKHGIRGGDRRDSYGPQMANIAAMLDDDRMTANVIAYINSLK